jgi:hypothetical protein
MYKKIAIKMNLNALHAKKTECIGIYLLCMLTGIISLIIPIIVLIFIMKRNNKQEIDNFKNFIENILNFYVNVFLVNFVLSIFSILTFILNIKSLFSFSIIILISFQIFIIIQMLMAIINIYLNKSFKFPFNKKWIRYSKNTKGIIL